MPAAGAGAGKDAAEEAWDDGCVGGGGWGGGEGGGEVQHAPEGDEVGCVGVVLDVADYAVGEVGGVGGCGGEGDGGGGGRDGAVGGGPVGGGPVGGGAVGNGAVGAGRNGSSTVGSSGGGAVRDEGLGLSVRLRVGGAGTGAGTGAGAGAGPGPGLRVTDAHCGRFVDRGEPRRVNARGEGVALGQGLGVLVAVRVVEVVGGVAKSVDLELGEQVSRQFLQQPVKDQAAFNGALGVKDKDDLGVLRVVYLFDDDAVADPHVGGGIAPVPLDEALDDIEDDAGAEK